MNNDAGATGLLHVRRRRARERRVSRAPRWLMRCGELAKTVTPAKIVLYLLRKGKAAMLRNIARRLAGSGFLGAGPPAAVTRRALAAAQDLSDAEPARLTAGVIYGVLITGGLGDALVAARLLRDVQNMLGPGRQFDVYFQAPNVAESFFAKIPGFRACIHANCFEAAVPFYDFALTVNQFVTFKNEYIRRGQLLKNDPRVLKLFGQVQFARVTIEKYILDHPFLDGAFADLAVRKGFQRHTFLHEMLGVPYGGDRLELEVNPQGCQKFGLLPKQYITIHDGWDANFKIAASRPTKAIPVATLAEIVAGLKQARPDLAIVQIGGKTGKIIPGVDHNLKAQTTFAQSMDILAGSCLHIDSESGLVHLAACLGVKCTVLFGPTNAAWFGYPQNANILPKQCGNCWWSTDTWMEACPIGHEQPVCTASIRVKEVVERSLALLEPAPARRLHPAESRAEPVEA